MKIPCIYTLTGRALPILSLKLPVPDGRFEVYIRTLKCPEEQHRKIFLVDSWIKETDE